MGKNPWQTLSSKTVYKNPWIKVREDKVIKPDGSEGIYGVIKKKPSVVVVPVSEQGEIYLVKVFRYTTGAESYELPAGHVEGKRPLQAAQDELQEEAGLKADSWRLLGEHFNSPGLSDMVIYSFLAADLKTGHEHQQAEEGISHVTALPSQRVMQMARSGSITDGITLMALFLAEPYLEVPRG